MALCIQSSYSPRWSPSGETSICLSVSLSLCLSLSPSLSVSVSLPLSLSLSLCLPLSLTLTISFSVSISLSVSCAHTHTHTQAGIQVPCFQDSSSSSSSEALNSAKLLLSGPITTEQQGSHFQTLLITSNRSKAYFSMPPKPMHIYLFRNYRPMLLYSYYCTA